MNPLRVFVLILFAFATALPAAAIPQARESQKAVEARLEQRYPQILAAKKQDKIGETWQGWIEIMDPAKHSDAQLKALVEQENADREELYKIIAAETTEDGVKVSAVRVGERSGQRNFRRAKSTEYFKTREGVWIQPDDLQELKTAGTIGETWLGTVEPVKPEFAADRRVSAVVAEENRTRAEQYAREARKFKDKSVQDIAEAAGSRNIAAAPRGTYVQERSGAWVRK
jgi:uncharacterized protein YdbL (DUF1318 family)